MKRLLYLAALSMLVMLVSAPAALAQAGGPQGNDISCPAGSSANAAGTQCTDLATGQPVEPISQTLVNPPTSQTNPCPEFWALQEDGTCAPAIDPATGEPLGTIQPVDPTVTTEPYTPTVAAEQYTPATTALPATGGPALLLPAAGVLLMAGLVGMRLVHRRS